MQGVLTDQQNAGINLYNFHISTLIKSYIKHKTFVRKVF